MKSLLNILLFLLITISAVAQVDYNRLKGNWTEIRRETRSGYVYLPGLTQLHPTRQLTFTPDSILLLSDPDLGDTIFNNRPFFYDTRMMFMGRVHELKFLNDSVLQIIERTSKNEILKNDISSFYIRKEHADKKSKEILKTYALPVFRDSAYADSIRNSR